MALTQVKALGIAADSIDETKLADDSIDSEHYNDGSIDTAHIADNQITLAKMAGGTDGQIITYDANGDPVAVGPGSDGQVLTSTGAGSPPAFETISTQDTLSNRNILYNGAMQISQRAASTGVGASNGTIFATDRWGLYTQNTGSRYTISQDGESPDGFGYSLKIACTTADTSLAANEEVNLNQKIEGFDVQRFQKGTSGAKAYTLSFWAKSVKTGTYIVRLLGRDNTTSNVSKAYSVANANWNKYTLNFPADTDTNRKDDNDNGEALRIQFWLVAGSGVNTGTLQETWANSADSGAATGQVNFADSTSNIFYLTGVQLESGSTATEFEHEPMVITKAKCQRYYFKPAGDWTFSTSSNGGNDLRNITQGYFPTSMRAAPTHSFSDASGNTGKLYYHSTNVGNGGNTNLSTVYSGYNEDDFYLVTVNYTGYDCGRYREYFDAEL